LCFYDADHRDDGGMRIAPRTSVSHNITNNSGHTRELTRGARSRLSRHGFDNAMMDTPLDAALDSQAQARHQHKLTSGSGKNVVVDLDLEARDELSLHEINIQFAGYRVGAAHNTVHNRHHDGAGHGRHSSSDLVGTTQIEHYTPRAVYFSYQFYSCMPTRTEVMRLVPTSTGVCVLLRDEAYARDEVPLTLRYMIDTSNASFNEGIEFAEYLAHTSLYIDVWDANTLLHIGVVGIPLRKLMRQNAAMSKHTVECDVINYELYNTVNSGVSSMFIVDNGPINGTVVGAVQVILSNTGHEGAVAQSVVRSKHNHAFSDEQHVPLEGLNWRAFGDHGHSSHHSGLSGANRPRNSVRAKPLSESSPDLHKALSDARHTADGGMTAGQRNTLRSLTDTRGANSTCTLTYDEVAILFRRFRGAVKGSVQYSGDLLALLDMPSLAVALKKLVLMYRKYGDYEAMHKVREHT